MGVPKILYLFASPVFGVTGRGDPLEVASAVVVLDPIDVIDVAVG